MNTLCKQKAHTSQTTTKCLVQVSKGLKCHREKAIILMIHFVKYVANGMFEL